VGAAVGTDVGAMVGQKPQKPQQASDSLTSSSGTQSSTNVGAVSLMQNLAPATPFSVHETNGSHPSSNPDGCDDGTRLTEGEPVGIRDGRNDGRVLGDCDGRFEGLLDGFTDGTRMAEVGACDIEGPAEGSFVRTLLGDPLGERLGAFVGRKVGLSVGVELGDPDGDGLGHGPQEPSRKQNRSCKLVVQQTHVSKIERTIISFEQITNILSQDTKIKIPVRSLLRN
jgi:hypothetical protein